MLTTAESGLSLGLISIREWFVNYTQSALSVDRKSYQNSDSGQISIHKVLCTIERVDPHNSVFSAERLKKLTANLISAVSLAQLTVNYCKSTNVALV